MELDPAETEDDEKEEEFNPYASPESDPVAPETGTGPFRHLSFAEVRRLRNHSHSIRAMGALGLLTIGISIMYGLNNRFTKISLLAGGLGTIGMISSWWRPYWGQVGGIVFCCGLLWLFPIGTLIGIAAILAFAQSRSAFGEQRFRHAEIEGEFRVRKWDRRGRRR